MARIRSIKPEFPQSETLGRVSRDARLLFIELWGICDDHGRTRAASRMLASLLFPYDDDAPGLIDSWLDELEAQDCIRRYTVDGSTYLHIPKWLIHQKIDKPSKPQFPNPPEDSPSPREDSPNTHPRKGVEGKGKEGSGGESRGRPDKPARTPTGARTYLGWVESLPEDQEPLPADDPVFAYADRVGLPGDLLQLAWAWFENTYGPDGARSGKRYADWRRVFRNAVEGNWGKLWFTEGDGYRLTTVGLQLQRAQKSQEGA